VAAAVRVDNGFTIVRVTSSNANPGDRTLTVKDQGNGTQRQAIVRVAGAVTAPVTNTGSSSAGHAIALITGNGVNTQPSPRMLAPNPAPAPIADAKKQNDARIAFLGVPNLRNLMRLPVANPASAQDPGFKQRVAQLHGCMSPGNTSDQIDDAFFSWLSKQPQATIDACISKP
jgi:hypothetical protein